MLDTKDMPRFNFKALGTVASNVPANFSAIASSKVPGRNSPFQVQWKLAGSTKGPYFFNERLVYSCDRGMGMC